MRRRGLRFAPLVAALFPVAVLASGIQGIGVLSNRADVISVNASGIEAAIGCRG